MQEQSETFEQFVTELKLLAKNCRFRENDEMREKLIQKGSDLTLDKAIDVARTDEFSQAQLN